ncbi:hypothetical protein FKR81_25805 [Lentzea tibetensis]|uniref:HEAT repeat domain-containing protein n=1 Tax=Lentzea tibetensis TaxID=2591470 RepID=A0A563ENV8_9PSEU|nr:HEAT repeat domain-containing protein [Lentzea tibetensis]TWP49088.1 hypothetical protein FKR81_25805 [Lentzea tibetensis]
MGAQEWIDFDARVRQRWGDHPREPVWLACDRSGYVRERAVAQPAALGTPQALAVLALRCADWVPQVRDTARRACESLVDTPHGIVGLGRIAFALRRRTEGRWLVDRIVTALREASPDVLDAALKADDVLVKRAAYAAAIDADRLSLNLLRAAVRFEKDHVIRTHCAVKAIWTARATGQLGIVRELASNRIAAVRADVVHLLARAGDLGVARSALDDRSPLVRSTAQVALRRAGEEPAEHYRSAPLTPATIAGLGEIGAAADVPLILPALEHPLAGARAAAVRALRLLGFSVPVERLLGMLTDPSAAVVKQAARSLLDVPFTEQALWKLLDAGVPHARRAAHRLLRERGPRSRVRADLVLLHDPELGAGALANLRNWMVHDSRTAYMSARDGIEFASLVAGARSVLGDQTADELRFLLGST